MNSLIIEYDKLSLKNEKSSLSAKELMRFATVSYLLGKNSDSENFWSIAYNRFLEEKNETKAIRCAFWLSFQLLSNGDHAKGGGWISRANRLLERQKSFCVEVGYLLLPVALQSIFNGDNQTAYSKFTKCSQIAEQYNDMDLLTFSRHGQGRALIRMGEVSKGIALLDEAMVAVINDEVSEIFSGDVYCSVIEGCYEIFDMGRAQEWSIALSKWCNNHPGLVPYQGQCLVRSAEIKQLEGNWQVALQEAHRAGEWLSQPPGKPAAGTAFYRMAELYRLKGQYKEAEAAYHEGHKWGKKPQPGLALLRLAEGKIEMAISAAQRSLDETIYPSARAPLLSAYIDIMIQGNDLIKAEQAAKELAKIADDLSAPFLHALAHYGKGKLLLEKEKAQEALTILRSAATLWNTLKVPYELGRVRVLIGKACQKLGDDETARMELNAARHVFEELEAIPEIEQIDQLLKIDKDHKNSFGLTSREEEVLQKVAAGKTNKSIATDLFISERTVERHVSNIFLKLNLASRAAATAWAYENKIV